MKNRIKAFLWIMLFVLICIGLFKAKGDLFNVMIVITFVSGLAIPFKMCQGGRGNWHKKKSNVGKENRPFFTNYKNIL